MITTRLRRKRRIFREPEIAPSDYAYVKCDDEVRDAMTEQPKPSLVERLTHGKAPENAGSMSVSECYARMHLHELAVALRERAQQQYERSPKTGLDDTWLAAQLSQADWLDSEVSPR